MYVTVMQFKHMSCFVFCQLALIGISPAFAAERREVIIQSPDERIRAVLKIAEDGNAFLHSVERDGEPVVEPSSITVRLAGVGSLADGVSIVDVKERTIDETRKMPWGKTSQVRDHCRAATVRLKSKSGIEWDIELRAYGEGVAFRFGLPEQERLDEFVIESESTEFRLAGDPTILYMPLAHFKTSHEALYERKPLSQVPQEQLLATPLLAVWDDGQAVAITEARLRDFAGMYLEKRPSTQPSAERKGSVLQSRLSPLPDNASAVVAGKAPHWSPWRVVMLADRAGELIESNLLLYLNEPAESDFSWVRPGKTTWPWWNGIVEHGPPSTPEQNFANNKAFIDFCARHGIEYHAISSVAGDRPWFIQRDPGFGAPRPDTDVRRARPDIDLPRILAYAKSKGVAVRLWVHWKPFSEHMEEVLAQYERWGIKGLMIDFMDRDDQEMVAWQETALRAAAKHKIHIQFHGSYKPTGEHVTFPNLMNREGVLNLEYLKWTDQCAPPHNVNVAYTRNLAGLTDYHLGGFRAASREEFEPRDLRPLVLGSRAHHLALYVVYENPMPMLADVPEAYEDEPGFDFLIEVPTTWDETRFVAGEVGEYVVLARRSGNNWYLGGITNWTPRELALPLEFLGDGQFEAHAYMDGSLDGARPNEIRVETREVSGADKLDVSLAPGGGIAAVLRAM